MNFFCDGKIVLSHKQQTKLRDILTLPLNTRNRATCQIPETFTSSKEILLACGAGVNGEGEAENLSRRVRKSGYEVEKKKEINVENEEAKGKVAAILNTENIQGKLTGVP